jgi:imidazolonepropionase-like amidohydrolase
MVTANPSRLLGLPATAGHESIRVGASANLTVFEIDGPGNRVRIVRTVVAGREVHNAVA